MTIGPFLRREFTTSVRGSRAFVDRRGAVLLAGSIELGALILWDYQGWDRTSVSGARTFGLATFAVLVGAMMCLAMGMVADQTASAIAAERDRKTLDALLASRFASTEIVLGAVASGLIRYALLVASVVPVVVLMVYLGGVVPGWVVLASVGLATTSCLIAGISVAASVESKTAAGAISTAAASFAAWLSLPPLYLVSRPFAWPGSPAWLSSLSIAFLDSSPVGPVLNALGIVPRPWGLVEGVARMAALQWVAASALVVLAIVRLRPASRALYDVEGQKGRIKALKAGWRRAPRRPSCYDDPVLWREVHSTRGLGRGRRLLDRMTLMAWFAALAWGTWWFARPAFAELWERGYGASPEAFVVPEMHPLMRWLVGLRMPSLAQAPAPGQARLELNMMLRLASALYALGFAASAFSMAFDGMKQERRRDTWLGLIATALTPREILRGKALGALWRARFGALTLVAFWTLGLLAGAVHPLGWLVSVALLSASGAFFASLGLRSALMECEAETRGETSFPIVLLPLLFAGSILLTVGPLALAWAGLFTYEDVAAATRGGPFPELRETLGDSPLTAWAGARSVIVCCLVAIASLGFGAYRLARRNERTFDEAAGRPVRLEG